MQSVDLIIFDLDGTLVDSRRDLANAVNYARSCFELPPLDVETVMGFVGDGLSKLVERSFPESVWEHLNEAIENFRKFYREHLLDNTTLYPGVEEVLQHFQQKKMAVISNKPQKFTRAILEGLRVADSFNIIFGGDSAKSMKPSPEPILAVMNVLHAEPCRTVMVGDGPTDIEAGKKAEAMTCAVTYGLKTKKTLMSLEPDFIVDEIQELKKLIV